MQSKLSGNSDRAYLGGGEGGSKVLKESRCQEGIELNSTPATCPGFKCSHSWKVGMALRLKTEDVVPSLTVLQSPHAQWDHLFTPSSTKRSAKVFLSPHLAECDFTVQVR